MSAWRQYLLDKGFNPGAAITKYRACKISSLGSDGLVVAQATAVTDIFFGVSDEEILTAEQTAGKRIRLVLMGVAIVECGAAVTAGQLLTFDTSGRAVPAVTASRSLGLALSTGSGAGKYVSVLVDSSNRLSP